VSSIPREERRIRRISFFTYLTHSESQITPAKCQHYDPKSDSKSASDYFSDSVPNPGSVSNSNSFAITDSVSASGSATDYISDSASDRISGSDYISDSISDWEYPSDSVSGSPRESVPVQGQNQEEEIIQEAVRLAATQSPNKMTTSCQESDFHAWLSTLWYAESLLLLVVMQSGDWHILWNGAIFNGILWLWTVRDFELWN